MNMTLDEIVQSGTPIYNLVGPFGARVGDLLFTKALGIGSFAIAMYLGVLGIRLLRRRRIEFWALTFRSALLAITLSIFVGLLTFTLESPTFWGGIHGHYVNAYLFDFSGWIGCFLVSIILIVAVVSVYLNALLRFYNHWKEAAKARKAARAAATEKLRQLAALRKAEEAAKEADDQKDSNDEKIEDDEELIVENLDESVDSDTENADNKQQSEAKDGSSSADEGFVIDPVTEKEEPVKVKEDTAESGEPGFEIDVPVIYIDNSGCDVAGPTDAITGDYDPRADLSHYKFPSLELLEDRPIRQTIDREEQEKNKDRIIKALGDHRITITSIKATVGPTVTLYEIVPSEGIRIAQI
ncbi:MAG: DNA translocase FtsK 4TM domain-containing protein, partial [Muribaculaceae bacterium]|nr:DNA translocase FtsK 4TM domain-containing protein [Muribaculaceae bacterium]